MTNASHPWELLGTVPPGHLVRDRLILHHAVQLIASFGQTFIPPRDDDSHRSMTWLTADRAFGGVPTEDGLQAVIQPVPFQLLLRRGAHTLEVLDLPGRSVDEARGWLAERMGASRGTGARTLAWPEYELPEEMPGTRQPVAPDTRGLEELARWYQDGYAALAALGEEHPEASGIRCWPHHFDIATLLTFPGDGGADARYVGVGLSPGDSSYDHPYFYVNGWPAPDPAALPPLPGPGRWHTRGWTGAVMESGAVIGAGDAEDQRAGVSAFLASAVQAMKHAVL